MYDAFSSDYDRFVNWQSRLEAELPFIQAQLDAAGARSILDAASGTGRHAIALVERGYKTAGADLSQQMVSRARQNAAAAGVDLRFEAAGFGGLAAAFGRSSFDALLCLGNSLPHVLSAAELAGALADFAACLRPGGLLLIQNRNFDAVLAGRLRWMEPQSHREGETEWIFLRFYDFDTDGLITFNILNLRREGKNPWQQQVYSTRLRPLLVEEEEDALAAAGFVEIRAYGSLGGEPFEARSSGNLVHAASLK